MKTKPSEELPLFDRRFLDTENHLTHLGSGSIGGKAAGLALIRREILPRLSLERFPWLSVSIPRTLVLSTSLFDQFMAQNRLLEVALSGQDDGHIAHAFQRTSFPAEYLGDLRALTTQLHTPIAIRSSSLLEDALDHPFAGVYATKMIPNNQPDVDSRFRRLMQAIKYVFSSTYFRSAQSYLRTTGQDTQAERMAVIIQEVVGQRHKDRFYPTVSGVARSYNYYPASGGRPEDGVVNLALGLGKTIVDGGMSWTYCPSRPKAPPPFKNLGDKMKNTQTRFWAVNMGKPPLPDPTKETEYLEEHGLDIAELDEVMPLLASTYDPQSDRFYPGINRQGPRLLDFAPILVYRRLELNDFIQQLLATAKDAIGSEIELEFALTFDPRTGQSARFGLLQVRPMRVADSETEVTPEDMDGEGVVLASNMVLGNGAPQGIQDVVFVKPETFDTCHTRLIAAELEQVNRTLLQSGTPYVLIGFGRWGSTDAWMGIPVEWGQICGAKVIVEATLPDIQPDMSQGSHFFHNMIAFKVIYMSLPPSGRHPIDWAWLNRQQVQWNGSFVKHVRCAESLDIRADGRVSRGVVRRHE